MAPRRRSHRHHLVATETQRDHPSPQAGRSAAAETQPHPAALGTTHRRNARSGHACPRQPCRACHRLEVQLVGLPSMVRQPQPRTTSTLTATPPPQIRPLVGETPHRRHPGKPSELARRSAPATTWWSGVELGGGARVWGFYPCPLRERRRGESS
jgi:hypothetical protein